MGKSYQNMNNTVIISTAGLGSRMGDISKNLNKALVPFNNKPLLSNIIEKFPKDTKFLIPVGYLSDQIKDFCNLVYTDYNIEFIEIDDYTSINSGPGYTVKKCFEKINNSFWYIPCDTYFTEDLLNLKYEEDIVFVKSVPKILSNQYTMFKLDKNDRVIDLKFKENTTDDYVALTGIMFIKDYIDFKKRLIESNSPEIIFTIKNNTKTKTLNSWQDFGNLGIYKSALIQSQKYDFTKTDEYTFFVNNKVCKWYSDSLIAQKKYNKVLFNPKVYPKNCNYKGQWFCYDFFHGSVLYDSYTKDTLRNLLHWLEKNVWIEKNENINNQCLEFYKIKSLNRIKKFLDRYPDIDDPKYIDNISVKSYTYYLENIDWNLLVNTNLPGHMHGDLHFDNTVLSNLNEFKMIDWRHEFAGLVDIGDIYYDLAKLCGGFILHYKKIKNNEFGYTEKNGNVNLCIPYIQNHDDFLKIVKEFIISKKWNYNKVKLLIPIIYWNMAPLHTPPFDKFLWFLGIKLFEEYFNQA